MVLCDEADTMLSIESNLTGHWGMQFAGRLAARISRLLLRRPRPAQPRVSPTARDGPTVCRPGRLRRSHVVSPNYVECVCGELNRFIYRIYSHRQTIVTTHLEVYNVTISALTTDSAIT